MYLAYCTISQGSVHSFEVIVRSLKQGAKVAQMGETRSQRPRIPRSNAGPSEVTDTSAEIRKNEARDAKNELAASIEEKLKHVPHLSSEACIFRVPRALRRVNEEAYTPQDISIGPYHHGTERLQAMEEHKMRYLSDFFGRGPINSIEDYVEELKELEGRARQCYGEPIKDDSDKFVEMMLVDGCFILELFFKFWEHKTQVETRDPLFHISMVMAIRVDLLLLENQLPLFILERLFFLYDDAGQTFLGGTFIALILNFFNFKRLLNMAQDVPRTKVDNDGAKHFLDLLRECCLPSSPNTPGDWGENCKFIPSATELHEAGVQFKKGTGNSFLDIKFSKNGVFEIPAVVVQDTTEVFFRNLIAFEQCCKGSNKHYITHYLALMDFLINSPRDVAMLRHCGIIDHLLGDNEQVCVLFNNIFMGVTIFPDRFYFYQLSKEVSHYFNTPWHSFRAMLDREYFYSPWSTASSIAVIIVVVSTIVQAVCSVISVQQNG